MRFVVVLFIIGLLLQGCTSVITVRPDEPLNNDQVFNYAQLKSRLEGIPATVVCRDGATFETDTLHMSPDSLIFVDKSDHILHQLANRDISKIVCTDYSAGAFSGTLVGALAGATTGFGLIFLITDRSQDSRMGAAVLELGAIGVGALFGAIIGSSRGSSIEYRFPSAEASK